MTLGMVLKKAKGLRFGLGNAGIVPWWFLLWLYCFVRKLSVMFWCGVHDIEKGILSLGSSGSHRWLCSWLLVCLAVSRKYSRISAWMSLATKPYFITLPYHWGSLPPLFCGCHTHLLGLRTVVLAVSIDSQETLHQRRLMVSSMLEFPLQSLANKYSYHGTHLQGVQNRLHKKV